MQRAVDWSVSARRWTRGDTDVLRAAVETVHRVAAAVLADLDQTDPRETAA